MKPSGIEWIGDIPDDWEVKRVKNTGKLIGGSAFPDEYQGVKNEEIPFIKVKSLAEDPISRNGKDSISESIRSKLNAEKFIIGSVVFAKVGAALLLQRFRILEFESCIDNNMMGFIPLVIEPRFFKYVTVLFDFSYFVNPGTVPSINQEQIGNIKIPFPPLKTQQKIADYLDEKCGEIDATIAKQKESIEKLKAYKQSLISETVTKGLDKSAPLKPSGIDYLGDIPSHWEIKKLKFVANFNQNTLPEDTDGQFELKYIDIGNVSSVDGIKEIQYFNFSNAPSRARRIVKYGDIIVSTVRTYLRAITSIKEDYDNCICSTGFAVITPKDNVQQDFVVYAIENESFIAQIIANSQGISYPAINVSQLENLKLAFPSVKEQKEIVDFLKTKLLEIDLTINKKQNIIQKLDAYKKSLIFECITGKHKIY